MTDYNLGRVGIVLKGNYDNSTAYDRLDLVFYQGRSYIARVPTTGKLPTDTTYWQVATYKGKGYVPRGTWAASLDYSNDLENIDVVSHDGVSYYCKETHTGRTDTPDTDTDYWGVLVAVGSAASITLADAEEHYDADDVEGALAEVYDRHALRTTAADNQLAVNQLSSQSAPEYPSFQKRTEGYGTADIPSNANGQMELGMEGTSLKNELNYTPETWEEWNLRENAKISDGCLVLTGNGFTESSTCPSDIRPNAKYGVLLFVKSNTISLYLRLNSNLEGNTTILVSSGVVGNVKRTIATQSVLGSNKLEISLSSTTTGEIATRDYRVFELPEDSEIEHDFENMTADELNVKYPYINGDNVKSVFGSQKVTSIGKNLVSKTCIIPNTYVSSSTGKLQPATGAETTDLFRISPNMNYRVSKSSVMLSQYDKERNYISKLTGSSPTTPFSKLTDSTAYWGRLDHFDLGVGYLDDVVLFKAFVAGSYNIDNSYEPYIESTKYISAHDGEKIAEMQSLPNGVRDEIVGDVLVKRVGIGTLGDELVPQPLDFTDGWNTLFATKTGPNSFIVSGQSTGGVVRHIGYTVGAPLCIELDIEKTAGTGFMVRNSEHTDNTFSVEASLSKDTIRGITSWGNVSSSNIYMMGNSEDTTYQVNSLSVKELGLSDGEPVMPSRNIVVSESVILYELAEPQYVKLDSIGNLKSYPNGTIYSEPCLWGYINTATKTIGTDKYPAKAITKLIRYDVLPDGTIAETDRTDKASLTNGNKGLTIADYKDGELYFYECEVDAAETTTPLVYANVCVDNGMISHDYKAAAADKVLDNNEGKAVYITLTNAGGNANLVAPAVEGKQYFVKNATGKTITIKTATSTGVALADGKTTLVLYNGTDYIKLSEITD